MPHTLGKKELIIRHLYFFSSLFFPHIIKALAGIMKQSFFPWKKRSFSSFVYFFSPQSQVFPWKKRNLAGNLVIFFFFVRNTVKKLNFFSSKKKVSANGTQVKHESKWLFFLAFFLAFILFRFFFPWEKRVWLGISVVVFFSHQTQGKRTFFPQLFSPKKIFFVQNATL